MGRCPQEEEWALSLGLQNRVVLGAVKFGLGIGQSRRKQEESKFTPESILWSVSALAYSGATSFLKQESDFVG